MSKTLILYYSRSGTALSTAGQIQLKLSNDSEVYSIADFDKNLDEYSNVIIGFPLYAGMIPNAVKKFIDSNIQYLSSKKNFIFCHGVLEGMKKNEKSFYSILKEGLGEMFLSKCILIDHLGGVVDFSKMNIIKKLMLSVLLNYYGFEKGNINTVNEEKIVKFIDAVNKNCRL